MSLEVPLASARFRRDVDVSGVRFVGVDQALDVFPRIRDAAARRRPGMLSRSAEHWRAELLDLPEDRDGAGPRRLAVLEDRGYVLYRLRPDETRGYPDGTVEVQELVAVDPEATAILYRFVCATDLATRLRAHARPVDDPLPLLVEDQARVEVRAWAPVYLRLLDLPRALVWRRYLGADRLVLEVADASRPANDGRWALEVTAGEATCTATTDAPDLVLDTRELAAAFLGGVPLARAAEAGHVEVRTPGAALRFDRLAAVPLAAWHTGMF